MWLERWEGGAQEHNRIVMRYGILQLHYGRCNCEFRSITRGEREGGEVRAWICDRIRGICFYSGCCQRLHVVYLSDTPRTRPLDARIIASPFDEAKARRETCVGNQWLARRTHAIHHLTLLRYGVVLRVLLE